MKKKNNKLSTEFTIKVKPVKSKKVKQYGLLAMVSLTINDEFAVNTIQIREAQKGKNKGELYVAFPQYKGSDDEYYNIFLPITAEAREQLITTILDEYEEVCED